MWACLGTHFTCFTGTKVQILTQLRGQIKPGGYDMLWLVQDFETAIRSELDCEHEARNCEIAARYAVCLLHWYLYWTIAHILTLRARSLLAGRRGVKFPKVVWALTRNDVC